MLLQAISIDFGACLRKMERQSLRFIHCRISAKSRRPRRNTGIGVPTCGFPRFAPVGSELDVIPRRRGLLTEDESLHIEPDIEVDFTLTRFHMHAHNPN